MRARDLMNYVEKLWCLTIDRKLVADLCLAAFAQASARVRIRGQREYVAGKRFGIEIRRDESRTAVGELRPTA